MQFTLLSNQSTARALRNILLTATLIITSVLTYNTIAAPTDTQAATQATAANTDALSLMAAAMRTADIERSINYYTRALNMVVRHKIETDTYTEVIMSFKGNEALAGIILVQSKGPTATLAVDHGNSQAKIIVKVADISAVAKNIKSTGFPASEIQVNGAYKVLIATDPDGYSIEAVQRPPQ